MIFLAFAYLKSKFYVNPSPNPSDLYPALSIFEFFIQLPYHFFTWVLKWLSALPFIPVPK